METDETVVSAADLGSPEGARKLVHDLRNLLAVIVNYCELIAEETGNPEAVQADLQEIRTAAERALALTDKLPRSPAGPSAEEASPRTT